MTSKPATDASTTAQTGDSMNKMPFLYEELMQLSDLMINECNISCETVTMKTDKYICIRDKVEDPEQLVIVDTETKSITFRRPVAVDSAIASPDSDIVALRKAEMLQIFNIDQKLKLKYYISPEAVVFWNWISENVIAIVTKTAYYHWNINDALDPVLVVKRPSNLNEYIISDYRADHTLKWILVVYKKTKDQADPGTIQIYSLQRQAEQIVDGFVGCYMTLTLEDRDIPSTIFVGVVKRQDREQLLITEVGSSTGLCGKWKQIVDLDFADGDYPTAMQVNEQNATTFIITKHGYLHMHEVVRGTFICRNKVLANDVLTTAPMVKGCGLAGVMCNGTVFKIQVNDETMINYILNQLQDPELAIIMASRYDLPGTEHLYIDKFQELIEKGDTVQAATLAATSPKGSLRNQDVIKTLRSSQSPKICSKPPILVYYQILLERGKLNRFESLELCKTVLNQGRNEMVRKWIDDDKLTWSEDLGDLLKELNLDKRLAFFLFLRSFLPGKVAQVTTDTSDFGNLLTYIKDNAVDMDMTSLLRGTCRVSPNDGLEMANIIVKEYNESLSINEIIEIFMEFNLVQKCTEFSLEVLKHNRESEGNLQTKIIELNLMAFPAVADAIIRSEMFTHFDKTYIAQLCMRVALTDLASELYQEVCRIPTDIGGQKQDSCVIMSQMEKSALPGDSVMNNTCKVHEELYQTFCFDHDSPCCRKCLWTFHNHCSDIRPLEEAVSDINIDYCLTGIETQCTEMLSKIRDLRQSRQENFTTITEARKTIETNMKAFRKQLDEHLDKLQEEFIKDLHETETEAIKQIYTTYASLTDMEKDISVVQSSIPMLKNKLEEDVDFFLNQQHVASRMKMFRTEFLSLEQKSSITRMTLSFNMNSYLKNLRESVTSFGDLKIYNEV